MKRQLGGVVLRAGKVWLLAAGLTVVGLMTSAAAQEGPGGLLNPQRDCKTIVTCSYERAGVYRGCVSSYSCRYCRFVPARCDIVGKRGTCRELRCGWGA